MPLDFVTDLVTFDESSRSRKGRPAGGIPVGRGECGARGRICTPLPGGLGIMPAGTMTGVRGASLDWDRRRRVTPVQTASQEAWLEPRLRRRKSLWREPWWNAGRRARPQAEGGASRRSVARPARRLRAGGTDLRLPAFRFLYFLPSSLRGAKRRSNPERYRCTGLLRFARNDDPSLFDIAVCRTRAPSRRENERTCPPPLKAGEGDHP